jgi:AcrR family transcriptional regulator
MAKPSPAKQGHKIAQTKGLDLPDEPSYNQNGQALGPKGRVTRERLMRAAGKLLATHTVSELQVADIAAGAGTSTAAFYRYFSDASAAALAVVATCTQSTEALLHLAAEDWPAADAIERAGVFVRMYIETWERHAAVLRMRNLAAEAGDARFGAARERGVRPLQDALSARVKRAQDDGRMTSELTPAATAGALIALLERMAAVSRIPSAQPEITHDTLVAATAFILARVLPALD